MPAVADMEHLQFFCLVLLTGCALCVTITPHGETGRLLGSRKCTYGPSYSCENIRNARECGSLLGCIKYNWKTLTLDPDTDSVCTICKDMVKQARDQLLSNMTQEELKEVLEGSCKLMPKLIAGECIELVDEYIPELDEMLASQLNPQVVCKVAGLCNIERTNNTSHESDQESQRDTADLTVLTPEEQGGPTCSVCRDRLGQLKRFVSSAEDNRILLALVPVCQELGSFSDICSTELYYGLDDIRRAIAESNEEDMCSMANLCPGLFSTEVSVDLATSPGIDCDLCIHFVKRWRNILTTNTTEHEFKTVLEGICHHSHSHEAECLKLVDRYYALIYHYLVEAMDAHKLCKAAGICSIAPELDQPVFMTIVGGDNPYSALLDSVDSSDEPQQQQQNTLHHVSLTRSRPDVDLPPHSFGHDSVSHANPLDGEIVDEEDIDPQFMQLPLSRMGLPDVSAIFRPNAEVCAVCEFALHELQKTLLNDSTEDEINKKVLHVCDLLPMSIESKCSHFVRQYGVFVISMMAQQINADQICSLIRVCPMPSMKTNLVSADDMSPPTCALCEFAMRELLDYLKKHKSAEDIRKGLDKLCSKLPSSLSLKCQELVNTFYQQIIDLIEADADPQQVCEDIHLCHVGTGPENDLVGNTIFNVNQIE